MSPRSSSRLLCLCLLSVLLAACGNRPRGGDVSRITTPEKGAVTLRQGFDDAPADWEFVEGTWQRETRGGNGVLAQTATERVFPVALWKKARFSDMGISVRFKPISGWIDASGGIVFRARDGRNYYVVRANSLEDNFRLYTVIDGDRDQIASTKIDAPALGQWHTLRVVAVGSRLQAYLDDKLLIDHQDETFQTGWVGLWTKADAVTDFDDLVVKGIPTKREGFQ